MGTGIIVFWLKKKSTTKGEEGEEEKEERKVEEVENKKRARGSTCSGRKEASNVQ